MTFLFALGASHFARFTDEPQETINGSLYTKIPLTDPKNIIQKFTFKPLNANYFQM